VEKRILAFIMEEGLIKPGDRLVLGVSGGPDSMALLHVMAALRRGLDIDITAAHVDHGLRSGAREEQDYVEASCRQLEVDFWSCRIDARQIAACEQKTLEEAGRDERYRFFREIARKKGAGLIATAHHRDDVAETVLLHLLRGSGLKGLRGILPRQGDLLRPLLCVDKEDILLYLKRGNIRYYIDESNEDLRFTRNRIRHELIPLLQSGYNVRIVDNLNQLALIARDENRWLEGLASEGYAAALLPEAGRRDEIVLDTTILQGQPAACQRRVLNAALSRLGGPAGWEMQDIEKVRNLQGKPGSARILHLKKGLRVRKVYNQLIFSKGMPDHYSYCYPIKGLPCCIDVRATGERFILEIVAQPGTVSPYVFYLDYDRIEGELCLRSRQDGDRFRPAAGRGSKKLKKYFIDRKVPWEKRQTMALLAVGKEILAIPGMDLSQTVRPGSNTCRYLAVRRQPLPADNICSTNRSKEQD
jgi:tRNA(Ile)-lysidine synthetase, N-terminal domain/tRNA(Ile)-lysidine synthetase, C-terminal domain